MQPIERVFKLKEYNNEKAFKLATLKMKGFVLWDLEEQSSKGSWV